MEEGGNIATTSLWKVGGNLKGTIDYIENEEKTKIPIDSLETTLNYAENSNKTEKQLYVTGINCNVDSALKEMNEVKKSFGKEKGIVAFHGYQSFKEGEVTPDEAHKIGIELANEMWGDRFQVVVTTHLNTNHIHNHFVVNSVSFVDGKKFNSCRKSTALLRSLNDRICEEHGLSFLEEKETPNKHINFKYYLGYDNYSTKTKRDIDNAVRNATTYKEFISLLNKQEYEVTNRYGKLSVKGKNYKRNIRIERQYGDDYTIKSIMERIKTEVPDAIPIFDKEIVRFTREKRKSHGLIGLYKYYCYLLKIYPKNIRKYNITYDMKDDVLKLEEYNKEINFLAKNNINSSEDFFKFKESEIDMIEKLKDEKKKLQDQKYRTKNPKELKRIESKIDELNQKIKDMNDELNICKNIELHEEKMNKNLDKYESEMNENERIK